MNDLSNAFPLFVAMCVAACSQSTNIASFASLDSESAYLWLDQHKNEHVCISGEIKGTMGFLAFRYTPIPSEDVGPYSSIIYTDISGKSAYSSKLKVGDSIKVCGLLKVEPNIGDYIDNRLDKRNYKLINSKIH